VVDQLEMADKAGWKQAYKQAGVKSTPIRDWIASQLITNLLVEPLPNSSHVVSVSYEALAAADAAKIANAVGVAVVERFDLQLVEDGILVPLLVGCHTALPLHIRYDGL
jgi:hypothetical protein